MYKIGIFSGDERYAKNIVHICNNMICVRETSLSYNIFSCAEELENYEGAPFVIFFFDTKIMCKTNSEHYIKIKKISQIVVCLNSMNQKTILKQRLRMFLIPQASERVFVFKRGCPEGMISEYAIHYVCAESNYIRVHTEEDSYLFAKTMKDAQRILKGSDIIRIHRSVMVNLAYVDGIRKNRVVMYNQTHFPLGGKYKEEVQKRLVEYKFQNR